jgi:glycosyltransferase involved in cell wall biosynthesis
LIDYEVRQRNNNERPLLALVMIVKDEAHTLPNTLIAVKPYLDWYFILDTGSKDGTPEAIVKTLGPNGNIFHVPTHPTTQPFHPLLHNAPKSNELV